MLEDNQIVIEAWNTVLFDKFSRFQHVFLTGLSQHSDALFAQDRPREGARVLDVGCGFGDTTLAIARMVGPSGRAVGVDCAQRFVDYGETAARKAGVDNASFFAADVQTEDLRGPYDRVFARFGTMFFNMPGAAMRNLRPKVMKVVPPRVRATYSTGRSTIRLIRLALGTVLLSCHPSASER